MLPSMISFRFPGIAHVACLFTTRTFGSVSLAEGEPDIPTVARRRELASLPGAEGFSEVHQVHGIRTVFEPEIQSPALRPAEQADGMATSRPGTALMIKTADCQPILIAHESGSYIMAIHSGWRGSRQNYPFLAVGEFCEHYRLNPKQLWAVRGPSLGPLASEFIHFSQEWGDEFLPWYDEARQTVDLWRLTRHQLEKAGLMPGKILGLDMCTFNNADSFYSYRHFRKAGSEDGRQGSLIWIRSL
ncbi:MAG: polyphenol oxidase family protein [Mailhella sp.]